MTQETEDKKQDLCLIMKYKRGYFQVSRGTKLRIVEMLNLRDVPDDFSPAFQNISEEKVNELHDFLMPFIHVMKTYITERQRERLLKS